MCPYCRKFCFQTSFAYDHRLQELRSQEGRITLYVILWVYIFLGFCLIHLDKLWTSKCHAKCEQTSIPPLRRRVKLLERTRKANLHEYIIPIIETLSRFAISHSLHARGNESVQGLGMITVLSWKKDTFRLAACGGPRHYVPLNTWSSLISAAN